MAYIHDIDLVFLGDGFLKHNDLDDLFKLLYDVGTHEFYDYECYNKHKDKKNHCLYWKAIAGEIQTFGGNTIANKLRGHGVKYKEIVCDVADKLKVKYNSNYSAEYIENQILIKLLEDAFNKMSEDDKQKFVNEFNKEFKNMSKNDREKLLQQNFDLNRLLKSQLTARNAFKVFKFAFKKGGFKSYQLTVIIVNAISKAVMKKGLTFAGNAALTKGMSLLVVSGPIGWVISGLVSIIDMSGPAYRVTIPVVPMVAMLRKEHIQRKLERERRPKIINYLSDKIEWVLNFFRFKGESK